MNLQELFSKMAKPSKPYVLGSGKPNKYNKTSLDGHRVLKNGSIVVRTINVAKPDVKNPGKKVPTPVDASYDASLIKSYKKALSSKVKA